MELDTNTQALIRSRLVAFVNSSEPDPNKLRNFSRRIDAVPVCHVWNGLFALRTDGTVLFRDNISGNADVEKNPFWIRTALCQAARNFPELSTLMPACPIEAIVCPRCHGTGTPDGMGSRKFLCRCGGLGWISPLEKSLSKSILDILWSFAREDDLRNSFSEWLYTHYDELEREIEKDLFLELIALDFNDDKAVAATRQRLKQFLDRLPGRECYCITLPSRYSRILSTDENMPELATLRSICSRTMWLHLKRCQSCGEWWYLAEDTVNDDVYFLRITPAEAEEIQGKGIWPAEFDGYREVWP